VITTVERDGGVAFSIRASGQCECECDVENECECERSGLFRGEHVDVTGGQKERSDNTRQIRLPVKRLALSSKRYFVF
jgi:hypothetical protein